MICCQNTGVPRKKLCTDHAMSVRVVVVIRGVHNIPDVSVLDSICLSRIAPIKISVCVLVISTKFAREVRCFSDKFSSSCRVETDLLIACAYSSSNFANRIKSLMSTLPIGDSVAGAELVS